MSRKDLSAELVEQRVRGLAKLSTLPHIALKVMELVENPRTSASTLAQIITVDQILAARILKLANSAYYGFPRKISTLNLAIVVLGFNALRDLVLSISVIDRFTSKQYDESFQVEQFWRHALIVGCGARVLSKFFHYPVAGEVFVAGLLHDIGYPILMQQFPESFRKALTYAKENNITFSEAEEKILGFTHAQVGGWLAEGWNLPEKLVRSIRYHHLPENNAQYHELVNLIHIADLICLTIGEDSGINEIGSISNEQLEQKINLYFSRNGHQLNFYQEKFRQEGEKISEFQEIITKKKDVKIN